MNRFVLGLLGAIVFLLAPLPAFAGSDALEELDQTYTPKGYVEFCERFPAECIQKGKKSARIRLTTKLWRELRQANALVNTRIKQVSDMELHGVSEYWTFSWEEGDCEEYVLVKKRELGKKGIPQSALRITVVLDEKSRGHAVLTVVTDAGDYILDNRRDDIRIWSNTGYKFMKRQSGDDPKKWVALTPGLQPVAVSSP